MFDVVIPVGPNDLDICEKQIVFTKENVLGKRNIYLVCVDPSIQIDGCITIPETIFPFTIATVAEIHGKCHRNGWYLQQLIKLYAGMVIPGILDTYLVIDCDTFFMRPTTFLCEKDKEAGADDSRKDEEICLYNFGTENHPPYFEHIGKLNVGVSRVDSSKSGICHHMIFQTKYVREMIEKAEDAYAHKHGQTQKFFLIFLQLVTDIHHSGASEYELYFNYMLTYHSDKIKLRPLLWCNSNSLAHENMDYVSLHWYMR